MTDRKQQEKEEVVNMNDAKQWNIPDRKQCDV